jgi:hypothetical protein
MALKLTPDVLAAAYEYLRATLPFRRWSLPPARDVRFRVVRYKWKRGTYGTDYGQHNIFVSEVCIIRTGTLIPVMGHEMCHLRQVMVGVPLGHGPKFQKMADLVCRHHGFDRALF